MSSWFTPTKCQAIGNDKSPSKMIFTLAESTAEGTCHKDVLYLAHDVSLGVMALKEK